MSEQDKRHQRHLPGQEKPPTAITAATEAEGDDATNLDDIPEDMKHQIAANNEALLERDAKASEAPPTPSLPLLSVTLSPEMAKLATEWYHEWGECASPDHKGDDCLTAMGKLDPMRNGAYHLISWLKNETDFFIAPASTKYHGAYPGGLVDHSVNVMRRLYEIAERDGVDVVKEEDTIIILGLLHDVCKINVYRPSVKRRKNATTGQWEDYQGYEYKDGFPMGHGEKSVFLIERYMHLTNEEALAIRWHMGAYDNAIKGGGRELAKAMELTPWVWRLHEADMCAAWIDEREKEN